MKTRDIGASAAIGRLPAPRSGAAIGRAARRAWLMVLLGLGMAPACADQIPTSAKGCPCAAGNVCCSSGACAARDDACGAAALGLAREAQGIWTGYLENFTFPSGSDSLEIALSAGATEMTAGIKMGADGASPLVVTWTPEAGASIDTQTLAAQVREGFTYQATDLRWESQRLKLTVRLGDPWTDYCAAYPPLTVEGYTFYCPRFANHTDTGCSIDVRGSEVPVDCSLLDRCFLDPYCVCSESACVVTSTQATLDIALRDDVADGSLIFNGRPPVNVRLARHDR